jgi:hypothetical protein
MAFFRRESGAAYQSSSQREREDIWANGANRAPGTRFFFFFTQIISNHASSGFPLPDDLQVFCRAISSKSLTLSPIKIEYSKSGSFASRAKESQAWKLKHRTLFRKYSLT